MRKNLLIIFFVSFSFPAFSQVNDDEIGAWYMYFWNTNFSESKVGLQGDIQYRNWNLIGDLEQLLLRGGLTYSPSPGIKLTLGYGHITSGVPGESSNNSEESRIYQEALMPHKIGRRIFLTHRFRYEQRWVENQDFRTRIRYTLFLNVPINQPNIEKKSIYFAFYNEIFINGEHSIGDGRRVEIFDRNRFYSGLGYGVTDNLRIQLGYLEQTGNQISKGQLQISLHHTY